MYGCAWKRAPTVQECEATSLSTTGDEATCTGGPIPLIPISCHRDTARCRVDNDILRAGRGYTAPPVRHPRRKHPLPAVRATARRRPDPGPCADSGSGSGRRATRCPKRVRHRWRDATAGGGHYPVRSQTGRYAAPTAKCSSRQIWSPGSQRRGEISSLSRPAMIKLNVASPSERSAQFWSRQHFSWFRHQSRLMQVTVLCLSPEPIPRSPMVNGPDQTLLHDEASVTSSWTVTTTCLDYLDCTGQVSSDRDGAPGTLQEWNVDGHARRTQLGACPDGTRPPVSRSSHSDHKPTSPSSKGGIRRSAPAAPAASIGG